ncbi:ribonuclease H-like domain-containing protein [Tanacetum coccineum]
MHNTTLNLYPTPNAPSLSKATVTTADLKHQLYLNMNSRPQDQAADPELWEILKEKDDNNVTLISRLDVSSPLHLHTNDFTALTVMSIKLKGTENYQIWSCAMLLALEGKNKIGFIDGSCRRSNTEEVLGKQWDRRNFPDVRSAYATISSEKSYRVTTGSIAGSSQRNQASAFVSNVPNRNNFQRNQNFNYGPRPNNVNNNRQGGGPVLVCEHCGFNSHTIDRCFKLIGYLVDFGKKKPRQNVKGKNISNNNSVGSSSYFGFTDEQLATIFSLIKDNSVGKNVKANMVVRHPNETEAFISKVGNLRLSNGLVLFDVLVVPEYCVTLISVH